MASFSITRIVPFVAPTNNWLLYPAIDHGLYVDVEKVWLKPDRIIDIFQWIKNLKTLVANT